MTHVEGNYSPSFEKPILDPEYEKLSGVLVSKIGGSMLGKEGIEEEIADVIRKFAGSPLILVHGGANKINDKLLKAGIEPKMKLGLRVTDARTLPFVVEALDGANGQLHRRLQDSGVNTKDYPSDAELLYGHILSSEESPTF